MTNKDQTNIDGDTTVNTENADEEQNIQPDNPLTNRDQPNIAGDTLVNTENANEDQDNQTAVNEPHVATPENTETSAQVDAEQTAQTSSNKILDAVDGLLLLSGSEDTMDGFESQGDSQIEFTQEVDMETLMTALHIESANEDTNHTQSNTSKNRECNPSNKKSTRRSSTCKKATTTNDIPKTQQKDVTTTPPTSPRGRIKIRNVTLKRHKENARNYYCQLCNDNVPYKGVHALNEHHRTEHNPVQCGVCSKWCSTPENLRRHSYTHYDKKYQCATCNEEFNFKSELRAHLIVHDTREGLHQCMKGGCGKRFKRKSELSVHVQVHTGKTWKCDFPGCDFEAPDKRYLRQHKNKHTVNNYICKYCHEGFSHYMQRKRHYEKHH